MKYMKSVQVKLRALPKLRDKYIRVHHRQRAKLHVDLVSVVIQDNTSPSAKLQTDFSAGALEDGVVQEITARVPNSKWTI